MIHFKGKKMGTSLAAKSCWTIAELTVVGIV